MRGVLEGGAGLPRKAKVHGGGVGSKGGVGLHPSVPANRPGRYLARDWAGGEEKGGQSERPGRHGLGMKADGAEKIHSGSNRQAAVQRNAEPGPPQAPTFEILHSAQGIL